jgi:hypothetical protein
MLCIAQWSQPLGCMRKFIRLLKLAGSGCKFSNFDYFYFFQPKYLVCLCVFFPSALTNTVFSKMGKFSRATNIFHIGEFVFLFIFAVHIYSAASIQIFAGSGKVSD